MSFLPYSWYRHAAWDNLEGSSNDDYIQVFKFEKITSSLSLTPTDISRMMNVQLFSLTPQTSAINEAKSKQQKREKEKSINFLFRHTTTLQQPPISHFPIVRFDFRSDPSFCIEESGYLNIKSIKRRIGSLRKKISHTTRPISEC